MTHLQIEWQRISNQSSGIKIERSGGVKKKKTKPKVVEIKKMILHGQEVEVKIYEYQEPDEYDSPFFGGAAKKGLSK
jgi:hypothetical protein